MQKIKCCKPVVILNPSVFKFYDKYTTIVIRNYHLSIDDLLCNRYKYSPKRWSVKPNEVDKCYLLNHTTGETYPLYIVVPCGRCILCRKKKANALSARAVAETNSNGSSPLFITLTYNQIRVPKNDVDGTYTLVKRDLQLFIKRLRTLLDNDFIEHNLRYLACGEYGSHTRRPHYHLLLWNFPMEKFPTMIEVERYIQKAWSFYMLDLDNKRIKVREQCKECPFRDMSKHSVYMCRVNNHNRLCGKSYVRSKSNSFIYRRIPYGIIKVLRGNAGAPAYITKYILKSGTSPSVNSEPCFVLASNRNGGIGSRYIREHKNFILSNPSLQYLKIPDLVTGSTRIFSLPINNWVKSQVLPSSSQYLKTKEYSMVKEFVTTIELFRQTANQLYRLYPMDRYIDGELKYYYDDFCDPLKNPLYKIAYDHVKEYHKPYIEHFNIATYIKTRDQFNEIMYTYVDRLEYLTPKILELHIDNDYFCFRQNYIDKRSEIFKEVFKDHRGYDVETIASNVAVESKRNEWKEYF